MSVIDEIAAERRRQVRSEGWTQRHDDEHQDRSLAAVAACYAYMGSLEDDDRVANAEDGYWPAGFVSLIQSMWPGSWGQEWWKPKTRRRDLIRAGALIVAEIERLDRAAESTTPPKGNAE